MGKADSPRHPAKNGGDGKRATGRGCATKMEEACTQQGEGGWVSDGRMQFKAIWADAYELLCNVIVSRLTLDVLVRQFGAKKKNIQD
jgi:hypothetical protein